MQGVPLLAQRDTVDKRLEAIGASRVGDSGPRRMPRTSTSRSVLFDGHKRHVLRDLDTGLVPAAGITPANAPEASVTGDITADPDHAGPRLAELHIDRAYLSSELVRDRGPDSGPSSGSRPASCAT